MRVYARNTGDSNQNTEFPRLIISSRNLSRVMQEGNNEISRVRVTPWIIVSCLLPFLLLISTAAAAPAISFLSVPSPDSSQVWVSGIVEDAEPADYVVVLYINVDGRWWGPKPYWNAPLTPIRSDRFWNTTFVTGGNDIHATRFAAYLIPRSAPGPGMPPSLAGASSLPASLSGFPSDERERTTPVLRKVPSFGRNGTDFVGLCFGPYLNGENPGNTTLSEEVIRTRLEAIRNDTTWVRSYGTGGGLEHFGPVAHSLGMKSAAGAWLTHDIEANQRELKALIAAGRSGDADVLIVGSETLLRNDLSERDLVTYIQWVRREVPGVPVGTADIYGKFIEHPAVIDASDLLFVHIFPFWEGVGTGTAVNDTIEKYRTVVQKAGGRPVVIAELGWPDAGSPKGSAVPSASNAFRYLHEMTALLHTEEIPYFYFSAFDEAWKTEEGDVGPHWGIRYGNLTLKSCHLPLLKPLPGHPGIPTDPDHDGIYEDLNGNNRLDFADVVLFFNQMEWIASHEPVWLFDLNRNGRIDFADIVNLFGEI